MLKSLNQQFFLNSLSRSYCIIMAGQMENHTQSGTEMSNLILYIMLHIDMRKKIIRY